MKANLLERAARLPGVAWLAARPTLWPWPLAVLFVALAGASLPNLSAAYDEGAYVFGARRVLQGGIPLVDFFHHQPPLYLYLLAPFSGSLMGARLLSLLATALSGVLLSAIARTMVTPGVALVAQLAFYWAPLQAAGLQAMPNAVMLLFSIAGAYSLLARDGRFWTALAGVSLAFAVLLKPIDASVVIAMILGAAVHREGRRKLPLLVLCGASTALCAWFSLHVLTSGAITELLKLQTSRVAGSRGFEALYQVPEFRRVVERHGNTPFLWSWHEHRRTFLTESGLLNGNLWLLVAAVLGLVLGRQLVPRRVVALLVLWLCVPLVFSLWVWEPTWDHYFVQYLPPLALGASLLCARAMREASSERRLAVFFAISYAVVGHIYRPYDHGWMESQRQLARRIEREEYLTFNPILHVVAGTIPACGLTDPQNVYGPTSMVSLAKDGAFERFHMTSQELVRCLGRETPVVVDRFAFWLMDMRLATHLLITQNRVVFESPHDKHRLREFVYFQRARDQRSGGE